MMNRRRFLGTGLGAAIALPLAGSRAFADEGRHVLTATDVHVKDYPTVEAVRWIGETMARETGGRVTLRQYHSGQLGRESEAIDMARFGAIDMTRVYAGALNNAFPLTQALCLPYVFDSVPHMRRAMDEGVGKAVLDGFSRRGLVGLAIYDSGARCFYNARRAIEKPADLPEPVATKPADTAVATTAAATTGTPGTGVLLGAVSGQTMYATDITGATAFTLSPQAISGSGGSQPHENTMPTLVVQYCIATEGIFPQQA